MAEILFLTAYHALLFRAFYFQNPYVYARSEALEQGFASWILLAFHTWVSMRWRSFALAAGVGVAGTFFALFAPGAGIGKFYPWLFPVNAVSTSPERMKIAILAGILGGAVLGVLGCWNMVRRDVE